MGRIAKRFSVPIVVGGVMAILTLNLEHLPFTGGVDSSVFFLLFPGMFAAIVLQGNVHAWSPWLAAALNGLIYFGVAWALMWALTGLAKERKWHLPRSR